jgi:hypothetical protein
MLLLLRQSPSLPSSTIKHESWGELTGSALSLELLVLALALPGGSAERERRSKDELASS